MWLSSGARAGRRDAATQQRNASHSHIQSAALCALPLGTAAETQMTTRLWLT